MSTLQEIVSDRMYGVTGSTQAFKLLSLAAEESLNGIIITDANQRILYINPAIVRICGYEPDEMLGRRPGEILQGPITDPETRTEIRQALEALKPVRVEIVNYRKSGEPYWIELQISPVLSPSGELEYFLAVEMDIDERKHAQELIRQQMEEMAILNDQLVDLNRQALKLAETDALTGLANRRVFQRSLQVATNAFHDQAAPLSLLMVDVDHFKSINDRFGHGIGDEVLIAVADVLRRKCNSVALAARVGGEEFAAICPSTEEDAMQLAVRIRTGMEELTELACSVTVSVGLANMTVGRTPDDLIRAADDALYKAKEQGRNRVIKEAA